MRLKNAQMEARIKYLGIIVVDHKFACVLSRMTPHTARTFQWHFRANRSRASVRGRVRGHNLQSGDYIKYHGMILKQNYSR